MGRRDVINDPSEMLLCGGREDMQVVVGDRRRRHGYARRHVIRDNQAGRSILLAPVADRVKLCGVPLRIIAVVARADSAHH
jgi:hypothetical protein